MIRSSDGPGSSPSPEWDFQQQFGLNERLQNLADQPAGHRQRFREVGCRRFLPPLNCCATSVINCRPRIRVRAGSQSRLLLLKVCPPILIGIGHLCSKQQDRPGRYNRTAGSESLPTTVDHAGRYDPGGKQGVELSVRNPERAGHNRAGQRSLQFTRYWASIDRAIERPAQDEEGQESENKPPTTGVPSINSFTV